jgi:hypothetical protein
VNRRIVIKTSLICFGIFLLLASAAVWLFSSKLSGSKYTFEDVIVADTKIEKGTIITELMLTEKSIPAEAKTKFMTGDKEKVVGTKAGEIIEAGDSIRTYSLLEKDKWFNDDERITVLPMEVEERMANLITRNSLIDIKTVSKEGRSLPKIVLSKVLVDDVIDENGISLGGTGVNKKAYAKLILSREQRDRLFAAKETGRLIYELYCNDVQKEPPEEYKLPNEFLIK